MGPPHRGTAVVLDKVVTSNVLHEFSTAPATNHPKTSQPSFVHRSLILATIIRSWIAGVVFLRFEVPFSLYEVRFSSAQGMAQILDLSHDDRYKDEFSRFTISGIDREDLG
ncbi:hypothetical protein PanWU01x14_100940 [Parasponia andersonii]|uniref:Uncharacterized protein n=1 Tax=Parasponia andersonii TaxID=3476 RepID=A0A2P5D2Z4_PARAD|nr:hypothetical protein PanWU01x14_100940 [Parasponia andersonii]